MKAKTKRAIERYATTEVKRIRRARGDIFTEVNLLPFWNKRPREERDYYLNLIMVSWENGQRDDAGHK